MLNKKVQKERDSPKKLWKLVDEVVAKNEGDKIHNVKDVGDELISDGEQMVNIFNNYFINVSKHQVDNINKPNNYVEQRSLSCQSIFLYSATETEIKYIISQELKPYKAPGFEKITPETLKKKIVQYIGTPLKVIKIVY
ncbi:hypothetical protein JTB14_028420 [Gonioctena quinquepunctata]|nr:hypothetical protein JTB14_028420 [Gonioctena quinquepunctata]